MKSTSTTSEPIYTSSLIWSIRVIVLPPNSPEGNRTTSSPRVSSSAPCKVGVHYFHSTALIYKHSFHIVSFNLECDYQGVIVRLDGSDLAFVRESQYR